MGLETAKFGPKLEVRDLSLEHSFTMFSLDLAQFHPPPPPSKKTFSYFIQDEKEWGGREGFNTFVSISKVLVLMPD